MSTYTISDNSFDMNTIEPGDVIEFVFSGSELSYVFPAGKYELVGVGGSGNVGYRTTSPSGQYAYVGQGGTSSGTLDTEDSVSLFINVGGSGSASKNTSSINEGGYNGGGSTTYYGGPGGGATSVCLSSGLLSSFNDNIQDVVLVAGGGGGSTWYSNSYYGIGGPGGGTSGSAGNSNGSSNTTYAGQGGTQSAGGASGTNTTRKGSAGSFGQGGSNTSNTNNYSCSGGGGGLYGGGAASNQEAGGGGGSGYVSSILSDSSTTVGSRGPEVQNGTLTITVVDIYNYQKYQIDLTLSGGNFTSENTNGIHYKREGSSETFTFIPLSSEDPVSVFVNGVDCSEDMTQTTLTSGISVDTTATGASYGFALRNNYYVSQNAGVAKSAAVARVHVTAVERTELTFTVINYAEEGYDYGVLGKLDVPLGQSYNSDNSGYWNGFASDRNKSSAQLVTYNVPIGEHFIDVKYIKDDATDENNDNFQFQVSSNPAAGSTRVEYSYTLSNIQADTEVKIVCGDVSSNFSIYAQGDHAIVYPETEMVYKGSSYELQFTLTDTEDYRYVGVRDNNVDVTNLVVPPHTMETPSYSVESVSGASYGFSLTSGYYQSQNNSNNTAALCKVVFSSPVPARVTLTYQNTGNGSNNFSMISELNTDLRTDSATDTSGILMNGSSNFHSSDTQLVINIPAGESYVTCKHKITSNQTRGNLKFKVAIDPLESLEVNHYTYRIEDVQSIHSIVVVSEKIPEYSVLVSCSPMGSVSPLGTVIVKEGGSIEFVFTPDTNYTVKNVYINSSPIGSYQTYTLSNINSDTNVYVLFTSGNEQLYLKIDDYKQVVQAYKKVNGRWVEVEYATVGDIYTKYKWKNRT